MRRQLDGLVGEHRALDVLHAVGSIDARRADDDCAGSITGQVGDGDKAVTIRVTAKAIEASRSGERGPGVERVQPFDRVVGTDAGEFGHVDIDGGYGTVRLDRADDFKLSDLDFAGEHPLLDVGHAVDEERLGEGARCRRVDPDLDIEPVVAVDKVVAAAALDDIAASTAEQDVTGREAVLAGFVDRTEEGIEAFDELDVAVFQGVVGRNSNRQTVGGKCDTAAAQIDLVVTAEEVGEPGARERFGLCVAVEDGAWRTGDRGWREQAVHHVGFEAVGIVLVGCPVETEGAEEALGAEAADHDVVTRFGVEILVAASGNKNVMADDRAVHAALDRQTLNEVAVVAEQQTVVEAAFQPVVALAADQRVLVSAAGAVIVALAEQHFVRIVAGPDEVVAGIGDDEVDALAGADDVVAAVGADFVVAELVGDDVVAVAAEGEVVADPAFDAVVAAIAVERVVTLIADEDVATRGAAEDNVLAADELQVVVVDVVDGCGVTIEVESAIADDLLVAVDGAQPRIEPIGDAFGIEVAEAVVVLLGLVDLELVVHRLEDVTRKVGGVGVAGDHFRELVVLELRGQVQVCKARQVVEAVAVLQVLHLHFEHEVEGGAQHAAEGHLLLGKATDPEVDGVQAAERAAGIRVLGVEEVQTIGRGSCATKHELSGGGALLNQRVGIQDRAVRAVGCDEVDDRGRVLEVGGKVGPARVGTNLGVAGAGIKLGTSEVESRHAGFTAARDVEHCEVKRQADKVVAQRLGDELVDLVADLTRHAARDGTGCGFGIDASRCEFNGVQEGLDQTDLLLRGASNTARADHFVVRVKAIDRLGQHRVTEAINGVGEFGEDGRVKLAVVVVEDVDERLDRACELFEHEVLILHLGRELGGLEQALAIPDGVVDGGGVEGCRGEVDVQPLVQERQLVGGVGLEDLEVFSGHTIRNGVGERRVGGLGFVDQQVLDEIDLAVVLGVEDVVDGGEADVLVTAAVAGHVVLVEKLVVVGAGGLAVGGCTGGSVGIGNFAGIRIGVMRDVIEEGVAGADLAIGGPDGSIGSTGLRDDDTGRRDRADELREACDGVGNEVAVGIDDDLRDRVDVEVVELDAEDVLGLGLDVGPGGDAATRGFVTVQQTACCDRLAVTQLIFTVEDLRGGVGRVGLVLVDERRDFVDGVAVLVERRAGQSHKVRVATGDVEGVVRLERDVHGAEPALPDEVEAVVEELSEQRHPAVEGR